MAFLVKAFHTSDPIKLQQAAQNEADVRAAKYEEELAEHAPNSLSHFIEYMEPDLPPPTHIEEGLCPVLEAMERRDVLRATFSVPTGYAKSNTCSIMYPAWYIGRNPRHIYLQAGHTQQFVEKKFGRPMRDVIRSPKFQRIFPEAVPDPKQTALGDWVLDNGKGGYVAKGVGQRIAGYRGMAGGGDDLIGSREDAESKLVRDKVWDWLWADYRLRFLPNAPIFLVATRWHPDDPIGRIEDMNRRGVGLPWTVVNLNVIIETEEEMQADIMGRSIGEVLWPEYYTKPMVLELKETLPARDWWAIQKGQPRISEGNIVKRGWFRRYKPNELPRNVIGHNSGDVIERNIRRITLSVDCANKKTARANPTVITVWVEDMRGHHYLVHVERQKVEFVELTNLIEQTALDWNADSILVEDKGNGTAYIQQRSGKAPAPIIAIQPEAEGNKWNRFDSVMPMIEAGEVYLPETAFWLTTYLEELLQFTGEGDDTDDQVDSTSQYLLWVRKAPTLRGNKKLR